MLIDTDTSVFFGIEQLYWIQKNMHSKSTSQSSSEYWDISKSGKCAHPHLTVHQALGIVLPIRQETNPLHPII